MGLPHSALVLGPSAVWVSACTATLPPCSGASALSTLFSAVEITLRVRSVFWLGALGPACAHMTHICALSSSYRHSDFMTQDSALLAVDVLPCVQQHHSHTVCVR